MIDKADLSKGFWVGLGLLLAYMVWTLVTGLAGRAVAAGRGRGN